MRGQQFLLTKTDKEEQSAAAEASRLFFNPANPAAGKGRFANSRWFPRKGPRGLILAGPLSVMVLLFTSRAAESEADEKRAMHAKKGVGTY